MDDMIEHDALLEDRMRLIGTAWSGKVADLRAGNLDLSDRARFADRLLEVVALLYYQGDRAVPDSEITDWLAEQITACERAAKTSPRQRRMLWLTEVLRGILREHHVWDTESELCCVTCSEVYPDRQPGGDWPCPTLRYLASLFVDRPGFNVSWLPSWHTADQEEGP